MHGEVDAWCCCGITRLSSGQVRRCSTECMGMKATHAENVAVERPDRTNLMRWIVVITVWSEQSDSPSTCFNMCLCDSAGMYTMRARWVATLYLKTPHPCM